MRIDRATVATILRSELRTLIRDRRTVFVSVVLPVLVMPVLLFAGQWMNQRREHRLDTTEFTYAVAGSRADLARTLLARTEKRLDAEDPPALRLREIAVDDPEEALKEGALDVLVEGLPAPAEGEQETDVDGDEPIPGVPVIRVVFKGDRDASGTAADRLRSALRRTRADLRAELLRDHGFPIPVDDAIPSHTADVASAAQVTGLKIGRLATVFFLLFILSGGAVVATDTLAGEKERGTLETLLTSAASRVDIVIAKLLAILAVAVAITLIQSVNFLAYVGFHLIPLPEGFALDVSPAVALLILALLLPVAGLLSAVLLLTSGRARSYKEAQLYFFPVFLLGLLPALAPFLPGLSLRSAIVAVPISNVAVAIKEILVGTYDWPMLALSAVVTLAAAAAVAWAAVRTLTTESLITPSAEPAGGSTGLPGLERNVIRVFAVMWAVLFIAGAAMEGHVDLRITLLFNLVVVFLGGSLLLIRRFRLDLRSALAVRMPHPVVWPAVIVGAPAGLLTGIAVFRLASHLLPIPPEMVEAFGRALAPDDIPFWQLLLFIAVLPGVCEEIAFRGVLLHGLHRRFHPVVLAVVVGLIFGFFHTLLFRILPTAFLGVILAALVLLTGSIFPAMLWHALNNGTALLAGHYGMALEDLDPGTHLAAAAILAIVLWVLWRTRRPYPGLRTAVRRRAGRNTNAPPE